MRLLLYCSIVTNPGAILGFQRSNGLVVIPPRLTLVYTRLYCYISQLAVIRWERNRRVLRKMVLRSSRSLIPGYPPSPTLASFYRRMYIRGGVAVLFWVWACGRFFRGPRASKIVPNVFAVTTDDNIKSRLYTSSLLDRETVRPDTQLVISGPISLFHSASSRWGFP